MSDFLSTKILGDLRVTGNTSLKDIIASALTLTGTLTIPSGDIVGLSSANITTALGFTPYNSTNPSSYSSTVGTVTSVATTGAISGGTFTTSGTISHLDTAGYKHIPTAGATGNFLKYSASGTATWVTPSYTAAALNGALALTVSAGATNTGLAVSLGTGFTANEPTANTITYDLDIGPALSNLPATMTGTTVGFLKKTAADTYGIDTTAYYHSGNLPPTDPNTTYDISTSDNGTSANINLNAGGSGSGTDSITLTPGTGISITPVGDVITIVNTAPDQNHNTDTLMSQAISAAATLHPLLASIVETSDSTSPDVTTAIRNNSIYIQPSTGTIYGTNAVFTGNLQVTGTTTTSNVETVSTANGVIFEGTIADEFELELIAGVLTVDRTITLPNLTGTVALTSQLTTANVTTNITIDHNASTVDINSSDGTDGTINAATTTTAGIMSEAMYDQFVLNTAKVTDSSHNTLTNLSIGTTTTTTVPILSSDGTDITTFPVATSLKAGMLNSTLYSNIIANNAKVTDVNHNVSTNISVVENATTVSINSSDGTDDSIAGATASLAGVVTNTTQTFGGVKTFDDGLKIETWTISKDATTDSLKFIFG